MTAAALKMPTRVHIPHLDNSLFKLAGAVIKLVLYVRPVARWPIAKQLRELENWDVTSTVIEGRDGGTLAEALRVLRSGRGLLVHSLRVISRSRKTIAATMQSVFDQKCVVVERDGFIYDKDNAEAALRGLLGGQPFREIDVAQHGGHNRIDDETRAKALEFWQDHGMSNASVEKQAGIPYATMRGWWQEEFPRETKRGRPEGAKDTKPRRKRKQ